jgi:hypothetical protein
MATFLEESDSKSGTVVPTNQSAALQIPFVWTAVITLSEVLTSVKEENAMFGRSEI